MWWRHNMNIEFGANRTTVDIIKEGAFGRAYFWDIYFGANGKFNELKNIPQNYWYVNVNK